MKSLNSRYRAVIRWSALVSLALAMLGQPALAAMSHGRALGTTAAFDQQQRLWIVRSEPVDKNAHVMVERSDDNGKTWQPAIRVTTKPEPVSADGENRPKIAFGPRDEIYVTWTSPTSAQFTGDIRFARSLDGGKSWSAPAVVHHDRQLITHRFESLLVDQTGRVWVTWIDKRDLERATAAGESYASASRADRALALAHVTGGTDMGVEFLARLFGEGSALAERDASRICEGGGCAEQGHEREGGEAADDVIFHGRKPYRSALPTSTAGFRGEGWLWGRCMK